MKKKYLISYLIIGAFTIAAPAAEPQNLFRYQVGQYEVYTLTDNASQGNIGILIDATPEMIAETLPEGTYPSAINAFLVKSPTGNFLFDTGLGKELLSNLRAAGIDPGDKLDIRLTHMHSDHIGGLLKDGERVFPNSTVSLSQVEYDYWTSKSEMEKLPQDKQGSFRNAQTTLEVYEKTGDVTKTPTLHLGEERGDGIFVIEAFGHTPGHVGYLLVSWEEKLLIWGDLTHVTPVQMPYPEIAVTYDVDPQAAIASRKAILEYVAKHHIPVAGMHIAGTWIGTIQPNGKGGYTFIPSSR
ncbi:MAG: MBL fold metallo-hydrolase [Bacteroides sp.]|nr:MBL fold metallo-hydrolase [Bacteroides sp.]